MLCPREMSLLYFLPLRSSSLEKRWDLNRFYICEQGQTKIYAKLGRPEEKRTICLWVGQERHHQGATSCWMRWTVQGRESMKEHPCGRNCLCKVRTGSSWCIKGILSMLTCSGMRRERKGLVGRTKSSDFREWSYGGNYSRSCHVIKCTSWKVGSNIEDELKKDNETVRQ